MANEFPLNSGLLQPELVMQQAENLWVWHSSQPK